MKFTYKEIDGQAKQYDLTAKEKFMFHTFYLVINTAIVICVILLFK